MSSKLPTLKYAKSDAKKFGKIARAAAGTYYRSVHLTEMYDDPTLSKSLVKRIREVANESKKEDTVMLFIAGHGLSDSSGRYYLATKMTVPGMHFRAALAWRRSRDLWRG
jgi:hypothetical protein